VRYSRLEKRLFIALLVFVMMTFFPTMHFAQSDVSETGVESATAAESPRAVDSDRRVQELRRYVKDDISRGNWARAQRNLGELVSLRKFDPEFQVTLGLVFRELGELSEARRKYRDYVEANGNQALASFLLAESYAQEKQREQALEHLEDAAQAGMNVMRAARRFPALLPYTQDTQFIRLSLRLENYELQKSGPGRTDPFTPEVGGRGLAQGGDADLQWSRQRQETILDLAQDQLKRVEFALRSQDEESAMAAYRKLQEQVPYLESFTEPDLAAEFRSTIARLADIEELIKGLKLTYLYDQAKSEIESMERAFLNRDFPVIDKRRSEVEKIAREIETTDETYFEVSELVRETADNWVNRARIWREFNTLDLVVQGIVISEDDRFGIIDNRILRVGSTHENLQVVED